MEAEIRVLRLVYKGRSYCNPERMRQVFLDSVNDLLSEDRWSNRGVLLHTENGPMLFCHYDCKGAYPHIRPGEGLVCCHPEYLDDDSRSVHLLPDAVGEITSRAQVFNNALWVLIEGTKGTPK